MDGTVTIESEPGEGTAVQLRFHFRQTGKEEIQKKREAENTEDDLSGLHVLLVEDNELNMEIAAAMLKEKGASRDLGQRRTAGGSTGSGKARRGLTISF